MSLCADPLTAQRRLMAMGIKGAWLHMLLL